MKEGKVCLIKSIDDGPVWIGSEVVVMSGDGILEHVEYHEGRLISMCERRKYSAWFVFKDGRTKKLYLVEIRNGMVNWPLWQRLITYIRSLRAYIHHRRFGHQLPL
jgi:hypothetical protein